MGFPPPLVLPTVGGILGPHTDIALCSSCCICSLALWLRLRWAVPLRIRRRTREPGKEGGSSGGGAPNKISTVDLQVGEGNMGMHYIHKYVLKLFLDVPKSVKYLLAYTTRMGMKSMYRDTRHAHKHLPHFFDRK